MLVHMTEAASPSRLLRPPADRPTGKRGPRGPTAAVAALAGLVPAAFARNATAVVWAQPALLAAAVALLAAALLLWSGRRRVALAMALVLALAGVAGTVAGIGAEQDAKAQAVQERSRWAGFGTTDILQRGARLTRADAEAIPMGLTRAELVERLGRPAAGGVQRVYDEPDMRCLAYRSPHGKYSPLHAFCFRDGRYVALRPW